MLEERFSQPESKKVKQLAEKTSHGELSSAATLFTARSPSLDEVESMKALLDRFSDPEGDLHKERKNDTPNDKQADAISLASLSLEAKTINHQAALLHGQRIKKAQTILKKYQEGAFSIWLVQTYGNRQTPYNFLLYHELFSSIEHSLQKKLEEMPKACAYALAARDGPLEKKQEVIGELFNTNRKTLFEEIQKRFPLPETDKRRKRWGIHLIQEANKLLHDINRYKNEISEEEMTHLKALSEKLYQSLKRS